MIKSVPIRGITRNPSDKSAVEGSCHESVNVVVDNNGEIAPIMRPTTLPFPPVDMEISGHGYMWQGMQYFYIHQAGRTTVYVGVDNARKVWGVVDNTAGNWPTSPLRLEENEEIVKCDSIGNTLIMKTSTRTLYLLWKEQQYALLGEHLPETGYYVYGPSYEEPELRELGLLKSDTDVVFDAVKALANSGYVALHYGEATGNIVNSNEDYATAILNYSAQNPAVIDAMHGAYDDLVKHFWEEYSARVGKAHKAGVLCNPVFVRWAYRLYDGSHVMQSAPILVDPSVFLKAKTVDKITLAGESGFAACTATASSAFRLYKLVMKKADTTDISAWSDIITGIDVFLSPEIHKSKIIHEAGAVKAVDSNTITVELKDESDAIEDFSNFYLVKSISLEDLTNEITIGAEDMKDKLGDNLVVQTTLEDDWHSHNRLSPGVIHTYNKRLLMAEVQETFFNGYTVPSSMRPDNTEELRSGSCWHFKFYVKNNNGQPEIYTWQQFSPLSLTGSDKLWGPGPWVYFPDANCYKCEVYYQDVTARSSEESLLTSIPMKPHPGLNGAYAFLGWISTGIPFEDGKRSTDPQGYRNIETYYLDTYQQKLYQSEVNNPFAFRPENIHTVPGGRIIGLATQTMPTTVDTFGRSPLFVFTESGIWAMDTNNDGTYSNLSPFTRDVCVSAKSICELDHAVAFASEKGVMIISGGQVNNVSENMNGELWNLGGDTSTDIVSKIREVCSLPDEIFEDTYSFLEYLKGASIAYDYKNNRLLVFNPSRNFIMVYSLNAGTWHRMAFDSNIYLQRTVNGYPDCLLSSSSHGLVNMSPEIDVTRGEALDQLIVTRPLDLGQPDVRKLLKRLRMRGKFISQISGVAPEKHLQYMLLGSMDGRNYGLLKSLHGGSYKYFKLVLLGKMTPAERLSYIDFEFDTRFTNRIR